MLLSRQRAPRTALQAAMSISEMSEAFIRRGSRAGHMMKRGSKRATFHLAPSRPFSQCFAISPHIPVSEHSGKAQRCSEIAVQKTPHNPVKA